MLCVIQKGLTDNGMRRRSQEYRARAQECEDLARRMSSHEAGHEFRRMARRFKEMAERAEREEVDRAKPTRDHKEK
jgi:hypothetical protein